MLAINRSNEKTKVEKKDQVMSKIKDALRPYYRPPKLAISAAYEYYFRPESRNPFGGPLNDQIHRQKMVVDILDLIQFDQMVETGTYCGSSTEWFGGIFPGPIQTVELNPYYYYYSKVRFLFNSRIEINFSNSVDYLRALASDKDMCKKCVFFYLDAHWNEYLPLRDEVEIIFANFERCVILIDDFKVEDDPGYSYDDYGSVGTLTLDYLSPTYHNDFSIYYPAIAADQESGKRRGSVVLTANPEFKKKLATASSLRFFNESKKML